MRRLWTVLLCLLLPLGLWASGAVQGTVTTHYNVAAPGSAPTAALANLGAGLVTSGTHSYKITRLDASGETLPSDASSSLTTAETTNGKVYVTIPAFISGQTGANVYRTVAGDTGDYLLVNASPITEAGDYLDNIADGSLGAAAPTSNTSAFFTAPTPTVALAGVGAGNVTTGAHSYKIQWIDDVGHTLASATASAVVTTDEATDGQVNVEIPAFPTDVATAPHTITNVNVFRTVAGDTGAYKLVNVSPLDAAGTYVDNVADGSLGADLVDTNTSGMGTPPEPDVALWNGGAGLCTDGAHLFKIAYATQFGPGPLSAASASVTTAAATNGVVNITAGAASTNPAVTGIYVYMTKAGGSTYDYAATIPNDTDPHEVSVADSSLTAEWTDTSADDTLIGSTEPSGYYSVFLRNNDGSNAVYVSFNGSIVDTSAGFYIPANGNLTIPYPVPLPGGGLIRLRSASAGVSVTYALWPK